MSFRRAITYSIAINLFFLALCLIFGDIKFGAIDDYFMAARLSGALKRDTLRVAELRKESAQRAAAFQNLGFKFVTPENEIDFGDFMGAMIEAFTKIDADGIKSLMYDSDLIAESYEYITETLNEDERNGKELGELFDMFLDYKRSRGEY